MFLSRLELNKEQILQKEVEFQQLLLNVDEARKAQRELQDFFNKLNKEDVGKYRYSYWRWYTWLSWNYLNGLSQDDLVNIAFGRQVPMALLLDIDVWKSLMWYFVANNYLEDDADSLYIKLKKIFLESAAILGVWEDKEVTVAEIVKEFYSIKQRGSDSLAVAEFNSKLQEILFSTDDPLADKYILVEPDTAIYRFTELMLFFYLMEPKDIWFAVDAFLHPEKVGAEEKPAIVAPTPAIVKPAPQPQAVPPKKEETALSNPPLPRPSGESTKPAAPVQPTVSPKPTPVQIKSQIEKEFSAEDVEGIMGKLNEMAEKNNDPKIVEMYYFDESSGEFLWK